MGGSLAAVLAAASLMQLAFNRLPEVRRLSLWGFGEGDEADSGPRAEPVALDVGDVLVVGAGAVASGFFYWCRELGLRGQWEVADGDRVRLHNTNRAMTFTASDAGWAGGVERGAGLMKVDAVAPGLPVRGFPGWYANWLHARGDRRPDLVLPLANDFDVRTAIGQRGENIILHATTSPMWTAQLHRHVAGRDDCIDCRLPGGRTIRFECAEAPLPVVTEPEDDESSDAALPFLSAGAGLLLLAALCQLEAGVFVAMKHNFWRLMLDLGPRFTIRGGVLTCREGCSKVLGMEVRERLNAGRRWVDV